jgi:hypothetical protein
VLCCGLCNIIVTKQAYAKLRIDKDLALGAIAADPKTDKPNYKRIAFLTVTSTIYKSSFIESPKIGVRTRKTISHAYVHSRVTYRCNKSYCLICVALLRTV